MTSDWQSRRSVFNHDWLKNTYLNRVAGAASRCSGTSPSWEQIARFCQSDLPAWEAHADEAGWLIESVEEQMSPRQLLSVEPLSAVPENSREWLGEVAHGMWVGRTGVHMKRDVAADALVRMQEAYGLAATSWGDLLDKRDVNGLRRLIEALAKAVEELSVVIHRFPRRIEVV